MKKIPPLKKKNRTPDPDSLAASVYWDMYSAGDAGTINEAGVVTAVPEKTPLEKAKELQTAVRD